jgi:tRNA(Arg) A34 adenosine deaminase TadA
MISKKDAKFIHLAADYAKQSPCLMKHGCVAVINGKVVSKGYNHYRNNSKDGFIHDCMTCHAEISALRDVHKKQLPFKKVTLYVCRIDGKNMLQESAPCAHCMDTIRLLNIKRVVHSANDNSLVKRTPRTYYSEHVTHGHKMMPCD